mmetsp:Transcript_18179/g.26019  ORF Transcript_18179/g.26019 Transcript_18179/m.26019 type:complete len:525 (+) Transcript_18179:2266-3840(+)
MFNGGSKIPIKDENEGSPWNGTGAIVFNGDFVDRGENSVGVILTLLLLKIAYPNNVYLNRGNHEDAILSTVYGFTDEIQARYGKGECDSTDDIWDAMGDLFSVLPLCVRTDTAAIMHGGIPSDGFQLSELESITTEQRSRIRSMLDPGDDAICELVQNVLWSDPRTEHGIHPNEDRGAGIFFGPDVTHRFLTDHGLKYLIRSHEVVDEGFHCMKCSEENSAITVFSSVNYPNGEGCNYGAVINICSDGTLAPVRFRGYEVGSIRSHNEYFNRTMSYLVEMISQNKSKLLSAFEKKAETKTLITTKEWADILSSQLDLHEVDWLSLQPYLAPIVTEGLEGENVEMIDFMKFLSLHCNLLSNAIDECDGETMETLRQNHVLLLTVFKFLDTNGNGLIDRDEFRAGMKLLKKRFPNEHRFDDPDALFDSIDFDGSGDIDINELEKAFQTTQMPYAEAIFRLFDKDHNGIIDREEFKEILLFLNCRLPPNEKFMIEKSDVLFDNLDEDNSGTLELDEIRHFLSSTVAE